MNSTAIEQPVMLAIYSARCAAFFFTQAKSPSGEIGASGKGNTVSFILPDPGWDVCRTSTYICVVRPPEIDCGRVSLVEPALPSQTNIGLI